jgi:hypothetical protein
MEIENYYHTIRTDGYYPPTTDINESMSNLIDDPQAIEIILSHTQDDNCSEDTTVYAKKDSQGKIIIY